MVWAIRYVVSRVFQRKATRNWKKFQAAVFKSFIHAFGSFELNIWILQGILQRSQELNYFRRSSIWLSLIDDIGLPTFALIWESLICIFKLFTGRKYRMPPRIQSHSHYLSNPSEFLANFQDICE